MLRFKGQPVEPQPKGLAQLGLHVIEDKDPEAAEAIDIVAIHGLNGHWDTTWTDEATKKNWLRDFLPLRFPKARVMSFSYNSVVQFSKAVADIADFADQLLTGLDSVRTTIAGQGRPLFFICHSLGGIVFKQASVAEKLRSLLFPIGYSHLRGPTQGVIFFGTPHRGSNAAGIGGMFGKILRSFSLGASTNVQLLKDLEVVEKDSAVLGGPKHEIAIPMDGNHRTICRFSSMDEPRLRTVFAELVSMTQQNLGRAQQISHGVLLNRLGQSNYQRHKARNPPAVPGTCSWILTRKEYTNWLQSPKSALMWFSANPGCGKSVTCSYLIDKMERRTGPAPVYVCYWFFKSDNTQQSSAISALQGLLRQVLEVQPGMTTAVEIAIKGKRLDTIVSLWTALTVAAGCTQAKTKTGPEFNEDLQPEEEQPTTICIVDGLDECTPLEKKDLLLVISEFYEQAGRSGIPSRGTLKMLVASRPKNSIKVAFDKLQNLTKNTSTQDQIGTSYSVIRLKGEDESDSTSGDVSLVIRAAVKDLINQGLPENLLSRIEKQLILRADRTFLWTTLILQLLAEKVEAGASRRELEEILQSRDIDSLFVEFLKSRPNAPKTRKLFGIILAATEPLSVEQLSIALATKPDHDALESLAKPFRPGPQTLDDLEYDVVYPHENHIRAIGGHFIRIIQDKVYFVHETAREFLLMQGKDEELTSPQSPDSDFEEVTLFEAEMDSRPPPQSIWHQSFSVAPCHALLLDICVTYIYMIGKSTTQPEGLRDTRHLLAFLPYAARSWWQHFQRVSPRIQSFNVPYYHNLCHPLFPGSAAWIHEYLDHKESLVSGLSADEEQDYYITLLGIGSVKDTDERHRRDREPNSLDMGSMGVLSSNPTAGSNYNFPVAANDNGFVSLDFDRLRLSRRGAKAAVSADAVSAEAKP
ncbi:hypothetical protein PG987_015911 [Apiospora arundinis]